jgi:hypothetical protein
MENRTIRLSEKIILRGPHPPPSPEERGPILQTEKFALFEAAYSWKTIFFMNVPLSSGEGLGVRPD